MVFTSSHKNKWRIFFILVFTLILSQRSYDNKEKQFINYRRSRILLNESPWPMYGYDAQHTNSSNQNSVMDSEVEWIFQFPGGTNYPIQDPVVDNEGTIYISTMAIRKNGMLKWRWYSGPAMEHVAILPKGELIGMMDGDLYSINKDNGNILWEFDANTNWGGVESLVVDNENEMIYFTALYEDHSKLFKIDINGIEQWHIEINKYTYDSLLTTDEKIIVFIMNNRNEYEMRAISINNGMTIWKVNDIKSPATIDKERNRIYAHKTAGYEATVVAIDLYSGNQVWESILPDYGYPMGMAIGNETNRKIYALCRLYFGGGRLYKISPEDGKIIWNISNNEKWAYHHESSLSPIASAEGNIYFACHDDAIYCLKYDGTIIWKYPINNYYPASPIISTEGRLVVALSSHQTYGSCLLSFKNRNIFPPSNLKVDRLTNRNIFSIEYVDELTWEANSLNNALDISNYKIYKFLGNSWQKLADINSDTLLYRVRNVSPYSVETYAVTSVGSGGEESTEISVVSN